ncbi:MAG: hypothetical protein KDB03_06820 [Planctomycetales bacterium]|nr:hypothetical protein [Planctomycetales bacterium]
MEVPIKRRPRALYLGCGLFLLLPIVLVVAVLSFVLGREWNARRELQDRLSQLAAQGMPIDNQSLSQWYGDHSSSGDSAAWMALLQKLDSQDFGQSLKGVPILSSENELPSHAFAPWPEEQIARDFLKRWQFELDTAIELSKKGQPVRFPRAFDSFRTLLPEVQGMRTVARLVQLESQLAIRDKNSKKVAECIAALNGCARTLDGDALLISSLVSIAIDGIAIDTLRRALEADVLETPELLELKDRMLENCAITERWHAAIIGERAMGLPAFSDPDVLGETGVPLLPARSKDMLFYLDIMQQVLDAPTDDLDQMLSSLKTIESELSQDVGWLRRFDTLLSCTVLPAVNGAGTAFVRHVSQHRLAVLAIGLRLHSHSTGAFPQTLADLKASTNLDFTTLLPTGGKPFGFQLDPSGESCVIWGVSPRNGGAVGPQPPTLDPADPQSFQDVPWIWKMRLDGQPDPASSIDKMEANP